MNKLSSVCFALFSLTSLTLFAGAPTITVTTTFDYPGTGNSTFPYGINKTGDIAGYYLDANGITRGFTRLHTGVFSNPIVDPNDTGGYTLAFGINKARTVDGYYLNATNSTYQGFLLSGRTYTGFDFPNTTSTFLFGLNDSGDVCGSGTDSTTGLLEAFVTIAGTSTIINVPAGYLLASSHGMNNADEVVGIYEDASGVTHGFLRNTNGSVTAPLDYPGAVSTQPQGINSKGLIVGRYTDASGVLHAYVEKLPRTFISYDYAGATATSFNDINDTNTMAGRYTDSAGLAHGFIAQLQ